MRLSPLPSLALALLIASASPSQAQTQPQTQAQTPNAYAQKIQTLMEVTNVREITQQQAMLLFQAIETPLMQQLTQTKNANNQGMPADMAREIVAIAKGVYMKNLNNVFPHLVQRVTPTYQKYFTEEEIDQLIAFSKSPVGKKSQSLAPALMKEISINTQSLVQTLVEQSKNEIVQKLKEKAQTDPRFR